MEKNTKKAVVVGLGVRYQKDEHELYPLYGKLYEQGYLYADRGDEDLYLLTEPVPEGTELHSTGDVYTLQNLGYEVWFLRPDGVLESA